MKKTFQKAPRLRLEQTFYAELRSKVVQRDGWRCQNCGAREQLQVHHRRFRSKGGADREENLITLCARCHDAAHGRFRVCDEEP